MKIRSDFSTLVVENAGSNARDFAMLEQNMLAHLQLALLLSILSTSLLLHVRLTPQVEDQRSQWSGVPLASLLFAGAVLSILAGTAEYHYGLRDLLNSAAFVAKTR